MFFQVPRKRPQKVDGRWYSFAALDRVMAWPESLSEQLEHTLERPDEADPLTRLLVERGVLERGETANEALFPLSEVGEGAWANSSRGLSLLESLPECTTVVDGLCWEEIARLPQEGALLYLGDGAGGFWVGPAAASKGRIPCGTCLLLRYLCGRAAAPLLYRALRQGATVAFENEMPPIELSPDSLLCWSRHGVSEVAEVLPHPDCKRCLAQSTVDRLTVSVFGPVTRLTSQGSDHSAGLGQMAWLCGHETVGQGGARDEDPKRGQARAVNEALERYAAHFVPALTPDGDALFESDEGSRPFPLQLALLTEPGSLSTGLACRETLEDAISDGLREVCERDALARFWLDLQDGACQVVLLDRTRLEGRETEVWQVDSYHQSTVICLARTQRGAVTGSACGPEAVSKAKQECLQNLAYLGTRLETVETELPEDFEQHMMAYWSGRYSFPDLAPFAVPRMTPRALPAPVYHCELTTADLKLVGVRAVRVLVPGLLRLPMSHHDWPDLLKGQRKPPELPHPFG